MGGTFSLLVLVDFDTLLEIGEAVGGGEILKTLLNVSDVRAGRLSARAALCNKGETVEEKL
jgi:hypothetical protein